MSFDDSTCISRAARCGHNATRSCGTNAITNIAPTKVNASEINAPRVGSWTASTNPIAIPTKALPNAINGAHDRPVNRPTIAAIDPTSATLANVCTHKRWSGQSASVAINPIHTPIIDVATAPRSRGLTPRGGGVIPSRFVQASVSSLPHSEEFIIVPRPTRVHTIVRRMHDGVSLFSAPSDPTRFATGSVGPGRCHNSGILGTPGIR